MKQGASWKEAERLLELDLPEMNARTRKHHELMQKHLDELKALLDAVITPSSEQVQ